MSGGSPSTMGLASVAPGEIRLYELELQELLASAVRGVEKWDVPPSSTLPLFTSGATFLRWVLGVVNMYFLTKVALHGYKESFARKLH